MDYCPFCEIVESNIERKLFEGQHVFATLSNPRLMPGHVLVIPKRHVGRLGELSKEELSELMDVAIKIQNRILEKFAPGCDFVQNYRPHMHADNYYKVHHLHVHLRPRQPKDRSELEVQPQHRKLFEDLSSKEAKEYYDLIFKDLLV